MKISVIIPVYNVEMYLEKCIDSVIMQTYKNIEILLINDGSTDNSKLLCEKYEKKYPYIKLINKINRGLSDTRNVGIKNSSGDYIMFLDSDDYWDKDFLSDLVEMVSDDNEIEYIFFRYKSFRQNSEFFLEENLKVDRNEIKTKNGVENLNYILNIHSDFHWSACRGLIKRRFIIENNLFFEVGRNYEDALFTPKVFLHAKKIDYYNEAIYVYRLERDGQITSNCSLKNLEDSIYVAKYWYIKLKNYKIDDEIKELLMRNFVIRYYFTIWFAGFINFEDRQTIIQELKSYNNLLKYNGDILTYVTSAMCKLIGFNATSIIFKYLISTKRKFKNTLKIKTNKHI